MFASLTGTGTMSWLSSAEHLMACPPQVTLFKRNYHHVVSDSYFKSYHTVARGNPNYFITYGNGKSAARMQPGLRPNGAHRWYSYTKAPKYAQIAPALPPDLCWLQAQMAAACHPIVVSM